jgi:hypothetical protein
MASMLVLDTPTAGCDHVTELNVEGPMPPALNLRIAAEISGNIATILQAFPKLRVLDMRGLFYNVCWTGLESSSTLRRVVIWTYENLDKQIVFPGSCMIDFHGLSSHIHDNPERVFMFIDSATQDVLKEDFHWGIGRYDPEHSFILDSIKFKQVLTNGAYQKIYSIRNLLSAFI